MKNITLLLIAAIYGCAIIYYQSIQLLPVIFVYLIVIVNSVSFVLYGVDKLAAIKSKSRVPEKYFYYLALLCGWPASLLGQMIFNHKTTKTIFRRWFFTMMWINLLVVGTCGFYVQT